MDETGFATPGIVEGDSMPDVHCASCDQIIPSESRPNEYGDAFCETCNLRFALIRWTVHAFVRKHPNLMGVHEDLPGRLSESAKPAIVELFEVGRTRIYVPSAGSDADGTVDIDLSLTKDELLKFVRDEQEKQGTEHGPGGGDTSAGTAVSPTPESSDWPDSPAEAILGHDVQTGEPVSLGLRERQQGTYIIGKPGTGKTTLIEHMVVQDIEHGLGVCVLDPHGDLIDAILARVPEERERDVIVLDAADTGFPFGLNLFECRDLSDRTLVGRVASQAVEVFEKLWGDTSWGPQLAQVLRNCAYTMAENQGYTLTEIRRLLTDDEFRGRLVANLTLPQAREFWELEYNSLPKREQLQRVSSTLNKVDEFLTPAIYPIVGFGRTTVDFRAAMDEGKVVLVKLPVGQLGSAPVALLGSIIVAQIFNAALSRQDLKPDARRQFNLFADEYHRFATPTFADLLTEARKYGLATSLAHQFRDQLDTANRGATLTAGNLIVYAVGGEDAEELAKQFDRTPPSAAVIGERPARSISQDPVRHLITHGHDDANVRYLSQKWIKTLISDMGSTEREERHLYTIEHGEVYKDNGQFFSNPRTLKDAAELINRYLIDAMEGILIPWSEDEIDRLGRIVVVLRGWLGICTEYRWNQFLGWQTVEMPDELMGGLALAMMKLRRQGNGERRPEDDEMDPLLAMLYGEALSQMNDAVKNEPKEVRMRIVGERAQSIFVRVMEFVFSLIQIARTLNESPILADTGQVEPILDRPRTYADVEGEIASKLVGLPKYTARARLLTGNQVAEHFLRSPEHAGTQTNLTVPTASGVQARTRAEHCAPLAEVLRAIAQRGKSTDDGPPAALRRVPV